MGAGSRGENVTLRRDRICSTPGFFYSEAKDRTGFLAVDSGEHRAGQRIVPRSLSGCAIYTRRCGENVADRRWEHCHRHQTCGAERSENVAPGVAGPRGDRQRPGGAEALRGLFAEFEAKATKSVGRTAPQFSPGWWSAENNALEMCIVTN